MIPISNKFNALFEHVNKTNTSEVEIKFVEKEQNTLNKTFNISDDVICVRFYFKDTLKLVCPDNMCYESEILSL